MRKDLKLGLGIGGLVLLFLAVFLVVKNHTEHQSLQSAESGLLVDAQDGSPGGTGQAPSGGVAGETPPNATTVTVLPPLSSVNGEVARSTTPDPAHGEAPPVNKPASTVAKAGSGDSKQPDVFDRRDGRQADTAMPPARPQSGKAAAGDNRSGQDWERILEDGVIDPAAPTPVVRVASPRPSRTKSSGDGASAVMFRPTEVSGGRISGSTGRSYTVQTGDTFVSIAESNYGNSKYYLKIEDANPRIDPTRLRPGQTIVLPDIPRSNTPDALTGPYERSEDNRPINNQYEYRVENGDSLYRIAVLVYGTPKMIDEIYSANKSTIGSDPGRLRLGMILRLPRPAERAALR